jgi:hypothetical protein
MLFLFILIIFAMPTAAFAMGLHQEVSPPNVQSVGEIVLDMAFVVTITAFLKSLFNVSGKPVMAIAFGVGVVIWAVPLISSAFPSAGVYIDSFFTFLKAWLAAMGSVDLVNDVGANIASVKATKTVETVGKE